MSTEGNDDAEREQRLSRVLAACLEALDQGRPLDAQEWLAHYPEFAPELAELIEGQVHLGQLTGGLGIPGRVRDATPSRDETPPPADATLQVLAPSAGLTATFGDYELIRELGAGGMGVVYEARQCSLRRTVALKMLRGDRPVSAAERRRFRDEAEAVAALDHPHLVPIYEVGELQGHAYFSMKLVTGGNLAQRLPEIRCDGRAAARLLARVARAVHHAHQRGVLHRDLKPSNILLDGDGEPYVTDFGLAKRLQAGSDLTPSGTIVGTPGYMAPEQSTGKKGAVTTAADVYGLGAVLYALLTGRAPFTGETPLDTLTKVREQEPEAPSRSNPRVPRDLEAICLKCLEKEPHRRYGSAEALAKDLERWLRGEPVQARAVGLLGRMRRWCRRKPGIAALTGATALFLTLLLIGGIWEWYRTVQQRNESLAQQAAILERQRALRRQLYAADMRLAYQAWEAGDLAVLHERLERYRPEPGEEDVRSFAWYYLRRLDRTVEPVTLRGHDGEVLCAVYAPDGRTLATGGVDRTVRLWDTATWRERAVLRGHTGPVQSLAFEPDGRTLVSAGGEGILRFWDAASGASRREVRVTREEVGLLSLSPDGQFASVGLKDRHLFLCEVASGKELFRVYSFEHWTFSPDSRLMAVANHGETLQILETTTHLPVRFPTPAAAYGALPVTFDHHGRGLAVGLEDGSMVVPVPVNDTTHWATFRGHTGKIRSLAFSNDDTLLGSTAEDGAVQIWDVPSQALRNTFVGHADSVNHLAFAPDHRTVASASRDGTVTIRDLNQGRERLSPKGASPPAGPTVFSPDGKTLAVAGHDGRIRLLDPTTLNVQCILPGQVYGVTDMVFLPNGRTLATISQDHMARLWDLTGGGEPMILTRKLETVNGFSADGRWLASGLANSFSVWDLELRQKPTTFHAEVGTVLSLAVTTDGRTLATGAADGTVRVWDVELRKERSCLHRTAPVTHLMFTPDGRTLAVITPKQTEFWNLDRDGEPHPVAERSPGHITAVALSRDGRRLAVGGHWFEGPNIGLWDTATRAHPTLVMRTGAVADHVALGPDGHYLAASFRNGRVRLFDLTRGGVRQPPGQPLGPVRGLAFSADGKMLAIGSLGTQRLRVRTYLLSMRGRSLNFDWQPAGEREGPALWDLTSGQMRRLPAQEEFQGYASLAFAPDGRSLAAGGTIGVIWRWDAASGQRQAYLPVAREARANSETRDHVQELARKGSFFMHFRADIHPLAYSPDSRTLATSDGEHTLLFDTARGYASAQLPVGASSLAYSPDGRTLAVARDAEVQLWDVATPQRLRILDNHGHVIQCLAFSPDGTTLATGDDNRRITLWDLHGTGAASLMGHTGPVNCIAFSPDGRSLASGGADRTVRVWHVATGQEVLTLPGHRGEVHAVAFSPDGTALASGGEAPHDTGEVYLWPAPRSEGGE